jgi:hypothetical protein
MTPFRFLQTFTVDLQHRWRRARFSGWSYHVTFKLAGVGTIRIVGVLQTRLRTSPGLATSPGVGRSPAGSA